MSKHEHCNDTGSCTDHSTLCLAVICESGANIVLFDASGQPKSFSHKGDIRKLCFSTHGREDAKSLLTPCFDEDGHHGSPLEDCFCGVETPHLHAHAHDPKICGNEEKECTDSFCSDNVEEDFRSLASVTLHPTHEMHVDTASTGTIDTYLKRTWRGQDTFEGSNEMTKKKKCGIHRLKQIHHEDHVDDLVFNDSTGSLQLEHACKSCGESDVHEKFHRVGERQAGNSRLHIFQVGKHPFSVRDLFDTESTGRVGVVLNPCGHSHGSSVNSTVTPGRKTPCCDGGRSKGTANVEDKAPTVRSTLVCSRICCSSEILMIHSVLDTVKGVAKIMVNVSLQQVLVEHDPELVTATDLEKFLNENHFGASIKQDGATNALKVAASSKGRSQFYVKRICCASEIPAIKAIVEPLEGVAKVSISTTTKMVYVDHNTSVVSASDICGALNAEEFGASVEKDAAEDLMTSVSASVHSLLRIATLNDGSAPAGIEIVESFLASYDTTELESFVVDPSGKTISVVHNPLLLSAKELEQRLRDHTGFDLEILEDGAEKKLWDFPEAREEEDVPAEMSARPSPYVLLSGIFWVVSMLSLIPGDNWEYLKYVGLASVVFGLPPIARKAVRSLRRFMFDANCLMLFAALGAVALQEYAEAAAVTFLFAISEWLEMRATARARNALSAIVQLRPDKARLVHPITNEVMEVPAASLPVGAVVSVKTGDKIPCDGVVLEGHSTVDESSLTGESRPIRKGPEDKVSGGTVNCGLTELLVRTTSTAENSAVARLIRLVEEAQANRSDTEKLVDEFARVYTPVIVIAAILMCTIPWAFGSDAGMKWTKNGLVLIVVACPCALIISTPVSYVAGLAATAQRGILVKGGAHLEALGMVKTICFDKTGTLSQGCFSLIHLDVIGDRTRREIFELLSVMEERASHPLAGAILAAAKNEGVTIPRGMFVKDHTFLAGEGVVGTINGLVVHVGNERLFARLGLLDCVPDGVKNAVQEWSSKGGTVGFMGIEGEGLVCAYCVSDAVRPEAAEAVCKLKKMGIDIMMLTGDNRDAALSIGRQVGLTDDGIHSGLLPEEKLDLVADLKGAGGKTSFLRNPCGRRDLVLMCGDGVNDAPALAAADVGVAMGAGAALALETADCSLLDSHLSKLVYSVKMGRRVIHKIKENVVFSVVVKFVVLGFALAGKSHLWAAIASDVGAMIIVTLNGMRLLPAKSSAPLLEVSEKKPKDLEQGGGCCSEGSNCCQNKGGTISMEKQGGGASELILPSKKKNGGGCCTGKTPGKSGGGCDSNQNCCADTATLSDACSRGRCSGDKTADLGDITGCCNSGKSCCAGNGALLDVGPILPSKKKNCAKSAKPEGSGECGQKACELGDRTGCCNSGKSCCAGKGTLLDVGPILPSESGGCKIKKANAVVSCCNSEKKSCGEKVTKCEADPKESGCCSGRDANATGVGVSCGTSRKDNCGENVIKTEVDLNTKPAVCDISQKDYCGEQETKFELDTSGKSSGSRSNRKSCCDGQVSMKMTGEENTEAGHDVDCCKHDKGCSAGDAPVLP